MSIGEKFEKPLCPKCGRQFTDEDIQTIVRTKAKFKNWIEHRIQLTIERTITQTISPIVRIITIQQVVDAENERLKNSFETNFREMIASWHRLVSNACQPSFRIDEKYARLMSNETMLNGIRELVKLGLFTDFCLGVRPDILNSDELGTMKIFYMKYVVPYSPILQVVSETPEQVVELWLKHSTNKGRTFKSWSIDLDDNDSLKNKVKINVFGKCTCGGILVKDKPPAEQAPTASQTIIKHRTVICSSCGRIVCANCNCDYTSSHVCDPETVRSFKTIKKCSKPCPVCGVRIQKSEGCSQMFCTICHTGFDYISGEIIKSNFHNPHRLEWLNSLSVNPSLRERIVDECGNITLDEFSYSGKYVNIYRSAIYLARDIQGRTRDLLYRNERERLLNQYLKKRIKSVNPNPIIRKYAKFALVYEQIQELTEGTSNVLFQILNSIERDGIYEDHYSIERLVLFAEVVKNFVRMIDEIGLIYGKQSIALFDYKNRYFDYKYRLGDELFEWEDINARIDVL